MARSKIASVTYTFLIRKDENIWNSILEFEADLADFFAAHQLQAEPITTIEGSTGNKMMMISRIQEMPRLDNKPPSQSDVKVNFSQQLPQVKIQKSSDMVKQLTNSLGKAIK